MTKIAAEPDARLWKALIQGDLESLALALESGASPEKGQDGWRPLGYLLIRSPYKASDFKLEAIKLLYEHGLERDSVDVSAYLSVVDSKLLAFFLDRGFPPDTEDSLGQPLIWNLIKNYIECKQGDYVELLEEVKCSIALVLEKAVELEVELFDLDYANREDVPFYEFLNELDGGHALCKELMAQHQSIKEKKQLMEALEEGAEPREDGKCRALNMPPRI